MRASRLVMAGIVVLSVGGASATAAAGSAADSGPEVIRLMIRGTSETMVDLGAKGFSAGDQEIVAVAVLNGGARVGSGGSLCQFVETSRTRVLESCTATLGLAAGQITATGLVASTSTAGPGRYTLAITGGTGSYRAARGELTVTPGSGRTVPVTIRLLR